MSAYEYKTEPLPHQRSVLRRTCRMTAFGLIWDPGVGKTKPMIDNFTWLYEQGEVNCLVVVAPNGVHRNWVSDEIRDHMPDRVRTKCKFLIWRADRQGTQKAKRARKEMLEHGGPIMVVVCYESTITKRFKQFYAALQKKRKIFLCLDEMHRIKGTKSHVKTSLTALGLYAKYRRGLTGTPLEQPEDIYTQVRFLDRNFWLKKGFKTPTEFRNRYCVIARRQKNVAETRSGFRPGNRTIEYDQLVGAKNLPELARYLSEITERLTLDTAGIKLPPRIFSKVYCELRPEQRRVYNELKKKSLTTLQSGDVLKAEQAITRLLRLQQISCGYVACEAEQPIQQIEPGINSRLDMVVGDLLKPLSHQAIVWSRFTEDIVQLLRALGKSAVRYDGKISDDDKARNKAIFQAGDAQFFVGNPKAGGTGLTLVGAKTMVFYSNYFDLINRLQAEARNYRVSQTMPVRIIDVICEDTVDEYIVDKLRMKMDIFQQITQDAPKEWI